MSISFVSSRPVWVQRLGDNSRLTDPPRIGVVSGDCREAQDDTTLAFETIHTSKPWDQIPAHTFPPSSHMSRRANGVHRCRDCAMHLTLCLCQELPNLRVRNRLCLVMHRDETRKTTNTGRLAARCLEGSEVVIHGRPGERAEPPSETFEPPTEYRRSGYRELLLFPGPGAEPLGPQHAQEGPVRLVVPDGTWRQATKMTRRIPWLAGLPRVSVPDGRRSHYRLRAVRKAGGIATMEAIARAFGILEGPEVRTELEGIFNKMVERTLFSRGDLSRDQVRGGLPADVMMHDPGRGVGECGW